MSYLLITHSGHPRHWICVKVALLWQSHTFVKSLIPLETKASVDGVRYVEKRHCFISSHGIFLHWTMSCFDLTWLWNGMNCFLCLCLSLCLCLCLFVCLSIYLFLICLSISLSTSSASDFASRDPCAVHFLCPVSDFRSKCIPRSFSAAPTASTSLNLIQMHGSSGLTSVQGGGVGARRMCNVQYCSVQCANQGIGGAAWNPPDELQSRTNPQFLQSAQTLFIFYSLGALDVMEPERPLTAHQYHDTKNVWSEWMNTF